MSDYHICMLGPSRCGKTTLLASLISEFMEISEDVSRNDSEYIKLSPQGDTKGRINKSIAEIKTSSEEGEFLRSVLRGTTDHNVFDVNMSYQKKAIINSDPNFKMHFHDFPGAWIPNGDSRLEDVKFNEAHVLIMPVDASLIFEAARPKHKASAKMQLELESLHDVAKVWANARRNAKSHPGLFIIAPIKCETYFNDNLPVGLKKDSSSELRRKVQVYFKDIVDTVHEINPETEAWYLPVDTMGCCFISDKEWIQSDDYGVQLQAKYKIPPGMRWTPFGPAQVMVKILEYIINDDEKNKGLLDRILDFVGWNTDLGKKVRKMQAACCDKYSRGCKLW